MAEGGHEMDEKMNDALLDELAACCARFGAKTRFEEGAPAQVGRTLKAALPATDEGEVMLMEMRLLWYNDDIYYLQYYTTLVTDIPSDAEIKKAISGMNFYCLLGNYGYFTPRKQLYHKYGLLLEQWSENATDHAVVTLGALYQLLASIYPAATGLCAGVITLEEAEAKGLLRHEPSETN